MTMHNTIIANLMPTIEKGTDSPLQELQFPCIVIILKYLFILQLQIYSLLAIGIVASIVALCSVYAPCATLCNKVSC